MNSKLNDGVGKKIVEALKKQSEGELPEIEEPSTIAIDGLIPNIEETVQEEIGPSTLDESKEEEQEEASNIFEESPIEENTEEEQEEITDNEQEEVEEEPVSINFPSETNTEETIDNSFNSTFPDFSMEETKPVKPTTTELNELEIPSNIVILKKLISQLPSGVTRHTGAQIIKQTMEALGISMKSVLKEAQDVQDNLKESAKECQSTIQEYRRQIASLEKQCQSYQRQYGALNDLISLFIQTTK